MKRDCTLGTITTPSPHKPKGVCFFDGMMYCGQLDQWYLIDQCILLALYKFQQRNELISFQMRIKFMELLKLKKFHFKIRWYIVVTGFYGINWPLQSFYLVCHFIKKW